MLDLWTSLAQKNAYPPPSQAAHEPRESPELDRILERVVRRLLPEFPEKPRGGFSGDPEKARGGFSGGPEKPRGAFSGFPEKLRGAFSAAAKVVYCALGRLHPGSASGRLLTAAMAETPPPADPDSHIVQAAILWYAIPLARRLQSAAFKALNQGETSGEATEDIAERLTSFLAARPLLSLRPDTEEFFAHSPPPALRGLEHSTGLRDWLLQRLASPAADPLIARRASVVQSIMQTWTPPEPALRDLLCLLARAPAPAPAPLLAEFAPLLHAGQWPDDLAPALRRRLLQEKSHDDDPH